MPLSLFSFFFLPLSLFSEVSKRTFFPGKSFLFWLLIGVALYVFYLYSRSKNKKDFFKSPYHLSLIIALFSFFVTFVSINVFLTDPVRQHSEKEVEKSREELIKEEQELFKKTEDNFLHTINHYDYVIKHFQIPHSWTDKNGLYIERDDYSIENYYKDRLIAVDTQYLDNAHLALGMIYYQKDDFTKSLDHLNSISRKDFPLANSFIAEIYLKQRDTMSAIIYFDKASRVPDIFQEESGMQLISLMEKSGRDKELYNLLQDNFYQKYFNSQLSSRLYFQNDQYVSYFKGKLFRIWKNVEWTGFIAAIAIMLAWGFYMIRLDIFEKENNLIMMLMVVSGMIFSVCCFYLYDYFEFVLGFYQKEDNLFIYSVLAIGVLEEFVKIVPLILLLIISRNIVNEPYDYILYASLSALGFSFMENLIYFQGDLSNVIHGRALTSVPGHIIDSSIVAYGFVIGKYRFKKLTVIGGFLIFFFIGALNHGLYDYLLFNDLYSVFLVVFLLSVSFWIIMINNCLNNSPSFNYLVAARSSRSQMALSISLLGVLLLEYIMVAWEKGPGYANVSFNGHLIFGGIMITYYSARLNNMDLVRGYWGGIPFKTISEKRGGKSFDPRNFIIRIFSGDTFTQSFIQKEVTLLSDPDNIRLLQYFNSYVRGTIVDRLVVTCTDSRGEKFNDPYWFRMQTIKPVDVGGEVESNFYFRFEEVRPSFEKEIRLTIYLFTLKEKGEVKGQLSREDFRRLGKALLQK